jgi:hypothetical protein
VKVDHKFFENLARLKYLSITVTGGNYRCEESKSRLNLVIACCPLNQNFLSSCKDYNIPNSNFTCCFIFVIFYPSWIGGEGGGSNRKLKNLT